MNDALEYTGERFCPEVRGYTAHEHWHRYCAVVEMAAGKDVLDLASGEGYGTAMLAEAARSVVGVDVSWEAVAHARRRYAKPIFVQGPAHHLDYPDASFDLVVSFETLEHLAEQDEMLAECKRVLRPGGRLVISTPNKAVFTDLEGAHVDHHIKELCDSEFLALCLRHFARLRLFAQHLLVTSAILPVYGEPTRFRTFSPPRSGPMLPFQGRYLIAICADDAAALDAPFDSVFYDVEDLILAEGGKLLPAPKAASVQEGEGDRPESLPNGLSSVAD